MPTDPIMSNISVVVTFYNQPYEKLFHTLYSIIRQKNSSFDIIITDDGSENFDQKKIENWFKNYHFARYVIVANKINQGTVLNALVGWKSSSSKYIKMLSPGDFLYNEDVLANLVDYMDEVQADICFGKIAPYKVNQNGEINIIYLKQPRDLQPYIQYNKKRIQYNYLIKRDYACGMSFAGKREEMIKYINKIAGKARFYEDCTYIIMVAAGLNLRLWNQNIIWYEVGGGISTSASSEGAKRGYESTKITYELIKREYPEWKKSYEPYERTLKAVTTKLIRGFYRRTFAKLKKQESIRPFTVITNHDYDVRELETILNQHNSSFTDQTR